MFSCFTAMRHDIAKAELWGSAFGLFIEGYQPASPVRIIMSGMQRKPMEWNM